jgi:hypothetical protein
VRSSMYIVLQCARFFFNCTISCLMHLCLQHYHPAAV